MVFDSKLIQKITKYAEENEKPSRFEHSKRVALLAQRMCGLYGLEPEKGYLAGLFHDICKDMDEGLMTELSLTDGMGMSREEIQKPSLLHDRAAAVFLKKEFGLDDEEILEAVALHTLGSRNAGRLAKVVFAADKIEIGRPQSSEKYIDNLLSKSLDEMVLSVLEENFSYLREKGKTVAERSLEFAEELRKNLCREKQ